MNKTNCQINGLHTSSTVAIQGVVFITAQALWIQIEKSLDFCRHELVVLYQFALTTAYIAPTDCDGLEPIRK